LKRIVVTGATGFIGNSLVEKLIERGYDVIPVGRSLKKWSSDFIKKNLIKIDLTESTLPDFEDVDCVCILSSVQPNKKNNWHKYYDLNSKQIFHFLNKNFSQLIYISSTTVNSTNGITNPLNYYGISKALAEKILNINKEHFKQCSILRFPSVMGVNHYGGIINDLKEWIEKNEEILLFDEGKKVRNILHVDDAVSSILQAIELRNILSQYEVFEVGSKDSISLRKISELLIKMMGKENKILLSKKSTNSKNIIVDNSYAISKLKYKPRSIKVGIKKYLKDCGYEI